MDISIIMDMCLFKPIPAIKKPRPYSNQNESLEHYFLTITLAEETKKHTDKVATYSTFGPDIVFSNDNNEKYAFEIETGTRAKKVSDMEEKVKKNNENNYTN